MWQKYREKRRLEESDEQVLGSIGNCLKARSLRDRWTESEARGGKGREGGGGDRGGDIPEAGENEEEGARQTAGMVEGSEPEAFKVKPGPLYFTISILVLIQLE